MSLKNVKNEEKNRVTLEILIPSDDFSKAVDKVYKRKAGQITVPGFRKGKAPRTIIEKMYGKGIFFEDALNDMLPSVLEAAVTEAKIDVVSQPELDLGDIDDTGVNLTAKYYVKPEITVKEYKGLKAERTVEKVSKEELDAEIDRVRQRNSRTVEITDRACDNGDIAVIDYEGFTGGKAFKGGKDEGHHLTLGSGQFIPGFEEQVVGHKIGDQFDVTVTFPENYHEESLKGQEAVFKVSLNGIEKTELPELDDDFAKDVSEFDTFAEYKKDLKAKIEQAKKDLADRKVEDQLLEALVANIEGDIPKCMFETECENMLNDYDARLSQQGLSLDMYLKYTGSTVEKMKEDFMPQAERQVKATLALEYIAKKEKFKVTDEQAEEEYKRVAEMYKLDVEKAKEFIGRDVIEKDVCSRLAVDLIKKEANVTESAKKAEKAEKAPAKKAEEKAAPKKTPAKKAEKTEKATPKKAAPKKTAKKTEENK